jgi:hypothetical protein
MDLYGLGHFLDHFKDDPALFCDDLDSLDFSSIEDGPAHVSLLESAYSNLVGLLFVSDQSEAIGFVGQLPKHCPTNLFRFS